jgi:3-hydroxyacyl-CoA dehydrogenase
MSVSVVGVVGAGFIGSRIVQSIAATGKQAIRYEATAEPLERSRAGVAGRVAHTTALEDLRGAAAT